MANAIQENIYKAIDNLVNNRIDKLALDRTVTATIVACTNSLTGEYRVSYGGGFTLAYAQDGATFNKNQTVYVLVPENDMSKKKVILSKAALTGDDNNISFVSSALSNYNLIGKNVITDTRKLLPLGLHSYRKTDYQLIYQHGEQGQFVNIDIEEFQNYLREAEALMIEASFLTRLPREHKLSKTGTYGLQFVLAFNDLDNVDEEGNPAIKYLSYTLDINNMLGNPYEFTTYSDQYAIFPIDTENFRYIESIMAYSQDFVSETDGINDGLYGADIFIKDLEIYGLRGISGVSGDYKLQISTPAGATFRSIQADSSLEIIARTTYKINQDLSDSTMYYWFAEDNRITTSSEDYQMYGGVGWRRLKKKGSNYRIQVYGDENLAYENNYLCVAVYKETVIMKEYFTIYNDACKRDIEVDSNLGIKFSFDRGNPVLTCSIDGKESDFDENRPDEFFNFVWSKSDDYNNTYIFNTTKEELEAQYDNGIQNGASYSDLVAIKNEIMQLEGVEFQIGDNHLQYPVKAIDDKAVFKCAAYTRDTAESEEYFIGSAQITLQNEDIASPQDYSILIENGEQVFQYSESGVAPTSERYTDPLQILPLVCHFYDPAGLEVNNKTYSVKWKVPLTNTLITAPKEGMQLNPATGLIEWNISETFALDIKDNYDYQALDNQITCIVEYQGQTYEKDTRLFFGKVGDNGINGTDIVAKISPTSEKTLLDKEILTLELLDGEPYRWNSGQELNDKVLDFDIYQRNEHLNTPSVDWSISGGTSKSFMSVDGGSVYWVGGTNQEYRTQIIKTRARLESQDYYAFYPIAVVNYSKNTYEEDKSYHIAIDKNYTLKDILYNADGRNPLYNKNQGIKLRIESNSKSNLDKFIVWNAEGGANGINPAFTLIKEKNSAKGLITQVPSTYEDEDGNFISENLNQIFILPNDVYEGLYTNNIVHGRIYTDRAVYEKGGKPEAEVFVPIHMSLNTFGLSSLNAWDGNHVEINEEDNYILAPQIGAGEKDSNNRFTGVVMGKAETYDSKDASVGLLGYSHGKQSIWLDSNTGNAIFGLPEQQASAGNRFTEGRIELIPGGDSKIGMWNIGSRAMYNMTAPPVTRKVYFGEGDNVEEVIQFQDNDGNWVDLEDRTVLDNVNFVGVDPLTPAFKGYVQSGKYNVANAQMSVPPNAQGMILGANPAYLSVKSMPLNEENSNIDWNAANTTIKQGDSLEVEIDPVKSSVFSIYRHTQWMGSQKTDDWRRYPLVGINANGQFYTNAIEDGESSMGIGKVGAFHDSAANNKYIGAQFGWRGKNLYKFFVDQEEDASDETKRLHISAGSTVDSYREDGTLKSRGNEYSRPFSFFGKEITLNAPTTGRENEPHTIHHIDISAKNFFAGHEAQAYINLPYTDDGELYTDRNLSIKTNLNRTLDFQTGNVSLLADKSYNSLIQEEKNEEIGRNFNLSIGKNFNFNTEFFRGEFALDAKIESLDNNLIFNFNRLEHSKLHAENGWDITSGPGKITAKNASAEGIWLIANPAGSEAELIDTTGTYLSLVPQTGGRSDFTLNSPNGMLVSKADVGNGFKGLELTQGFSSGWAVFTGYPGKPATIPSSQTDTRKYSILAQEHIRCMHTVFGSSFRWLTPGTHGNITYPNGGGSGSYSSDNVWSHMSHIYSLLGTIGSYSNSNRINLGNRITNLQGQVNNKAGNDVWDHVHKANNCLSAIKNVCSSASYVDANTLAKMIARVIAEGGN